MGWHDLYAVGAGCAQPATHGTGAAVGGAVTDSVKGRLSVFKYQDDGYRNNQFIDKNDTNERDELTAQVTALQSRDVVTRGEYNSVVAKLSTLDREAIALRSTAKSRLQMLQAERGKLEQTERENIALKRRYAALTAKANDAAAQVKALEKRVSRLQQQNRRLTEQLAAGGSGGAVGPDPPGAPSGRTPWGTGSRG